MGVDGKLPAPTLWEGMPFIGIFIKSLLDCYFQSTQADDHHQKTVFHYNFYKNLSCAVGP